MRPLPSLAVVALVALAPPAAALLPSACEAGAPLWCVPFERLASGLFSSTWGNFAIDTQAEWEGFWGAHTGGSRDPPPVDFSTHWVAAIVLNYGSCCHQPTQIVDVTYQGAYVVTFDTNPIGPMQAFSQPWDVVKVERQSDLPVVAAFVGASPTYPPYHALPLV